MSNYFCVALDNPKYDMNIGGAARACHCYGASLLIISGQRYKHEVTDTTKAHRSIPVLSVNDVLSVIPYDCVPVAVEILNGAIPLYKYVHPKNAYYIFGGEDANLGERIVSKCRDKIYVPTKFCMNLASTINVVLYDRLAKQIQSEEWNKMKENNVE